MTGASTAGIQWWDARLAELPGSLQRPTESPQVRATSVWEPGHGAERAGTPDRRAPLCSCRLSYAGRPRDQLGPRVAHGPVERVVRPLFPAVLGECGVGAVGILLELGERARLLLDVVGGARDRCGHGVVLAVGQEQQRAAA